MGLFRTVYKIHGDFSRKIAKFSHPFYFASPLKGFPLELDTGVGGQKLEWWGYRSTKKFDDIFSRLDRMHERDRQERLNFEGKASMQIII